MWVYLTIQNAKTEKNLDNALVSLRIGDTKILDFDAAPNGIFKAEIPESFLQEEGAVLTCDIEKEGFKKRTLSYPLEEVGDSIEDTVQLVPEPPPPKKIKINWKKVLKWGLIILGILLLAALIFWAVKTFIFPPPPPKASISFFTANSTPDALAVSPQQQVLLRWETKNAVSVTLNDEPVDPVDDKRVKLNESTDYVLKVTGEDGDKMSKGVDIEVVPLPVITTFTATPATIHQWGASVLKWETTGAVKLYIADTSDGTSMAGPPQVDTEPAQKTGADAGKTDAAGKTPSNAGQQKNNLQTTPSSDSAMESAILPPGSQKDLNGAIEVFPINTTTYLLTAENRIGARVTRSLDVKVLVAPEILSFTASQIKMRKGQSSILSWNTQHAGEVTLNGERTQPFFSEQVRPEVTTTYTLEVANQVGKRNRTLTVEIIIDEEEPDPDKPPPAPKINQFLTSPGEIAVGQTARLSWVTQDAEKVYLNGETVEPVGGKDVIPQENTAYTVKAVNKTGEVTWTRTVQVSPEPCKIILYELENYLGAYEEFTTDSPDIGLLNNTVSSIKIIGNCAVRAFSAPNFKATTQVFTQSVPRLRGTWIGNDTISSIKIIDVRGE